MDQRERQRRARVAATAILLLALGMATASVLDLADLQAAAAVRGLAPLGAAVVEPGSEAVATALAPPPRRWPVKHPHLFFAGELALAGLMALLYGWSRRAPRSAIWGALALALPSSIPLATQWPASAFPLLVRIVLMVLVARGLAAAPRASPAVPS
jgi:hypothetical protein